MKVYKIETKSRGAIGEMAYIESELAKIGANAWRLLMMNNDQRLSLWTVQQATDGVPIDHRGRELIVVALHEEQAVVHAMGLATWIGDFSGSWNKLGFELWVKNHLHRAPVIWYDDSPGGVVDGA